MMKAVAVSRSRGCQYTAVGGDGQWEQWELRIWGSVDKERRSRPSTEVYAGME
jgi:hypothetical protein